MKRCVLRWLLLLLAAGSLHAQQAPPTSASDAIFLWLAGGISSTRIQRLAQTQGKNWKFSCSATSPCIRQCTRALQKAGADSDLIHSLVRQSADQSSDRRPDRKLAPTDAGACSSPAAQVAALVHDKNFDAAENKIRTLLRDNADNDANHALLHFVLGTILRRQDRFAGRQARSREVADRGHGYADRR